MTRKINHLLIDWYFKVEIEWIRLFSGPETGTGGRGRSVPLETCDHMWRTITYAGIIILELYSLASQSSISITTSLPYLDPLELLAMLWKKKKRRGKISISGASFHRRLKQHSKMAAIHVSSFSLIKNLFASDFSFYVMVFSLRIIRYLFKLLVETIVIFMFF